MALGRRDIDAAFFQLLAIGGETGRQRSRLGQNGIERRAELGRQVNDHQNRRRKIAREFARQEAERIKAAGGGPYRQNVPVTHPDSSRRPRLEPAPFLKQYWIGISLRTTGA